MITPTPTPKLKLKFDAVRRLVVLCCLLGVCLASEPAADARDSAVVAGSAVPSYAMAWHVRLPEAASARSDQDCAGHPAPPPKSRTVPVASRTEHSGTGTLANTGGGRSMAALLMACALLGSGLVFRHAARRRKDDSTEG